MRKIELVPGIKSSVLGFGCAPILGAVDGQKSKRAIEVAIDCGINHFDLARSYGYGEAEKFVGRILAPNRNQFVIATKFGIKANWKAKAIQPVKPILRRTLSLIKKKKSENNVISQNTGASFAGHFLNRIEISPQEMIKSLEESLRNLHTDYIDYFFIHEPITTIQEIESLMNAADQLKRSGKIRAFGLAYMIEQEELHQEYLNQFDVLQFNKPITRQTYFEKKQERGNKANILFSPFRGGVSEFSPIEKLKTLAEDFSQSVILCSMSNEKHIKSNSSIFN